MVVLTTAALGESGGFRFACTAAGRLALPGCGSPVPGWWGCGGQAGSGMAAIRVNTATMSWAPGEQDSEGLAVAHDVRRSDT
jgi:hypothetical protein